MKMRQPPPSDPPAIQAGSSNLITQTREYAVITPLFGGGVTPMAADPITVVRGSEIRGQMRFWWRATRGGRYDGNLAAMKRDEDLIFGTAASYDKDGNVQGGPSVVQIATKVLNKGMEVAPFRVEPARNGRGLQVRHEEQSGVPAYAAFPLQPQKNELTSGHVILRKVRQGVRFAMTITFPTELQGSHGRIPIEQDLMATLWAWETFGGLGGRTRRGFGALKPLKIQQTPVKLPTSADIEDALYNALDANVLDGEWPPSVPHLARSDARQLAFMREDRDEASRCWSLQTDAYMKFRQIRQQSRVPGLNAWPEPDAIRQISKKPTRRERVIAKFPRAVLGLPIIFHFKDHDEPGDSTVQGINHDRMASRLILRPGACDDNLYVGIALVLDGPSLPPGGVRIKERQNSPTLQTELTEDEASTVDVLAGKPDILQAFLDYFEEYHS